MPPAASGGAPAVTLPSLPSAAEAGATCLHPAPPPGAQTARLFKRVGGGWEEVAPDGSRTPRQPVSPSRRPEPDLRRTSELFGVGTLGLGQRGESCNEALAHFEKIQRQRWLDNRTQQLAADQARAAAHPAKSPREQLQQRLERAKEKVEAREDEQDKRNARLAQERKERERALRDARLNDQDTRARQAEEWRQALAAGRQHIWQYQVPDTGGWDDLPPGHTDALEDRLRQPTHAAAPLHLPAAPAFGSASPVAAGGVGARAAAFDCRRLLAELAGHPPVPIRRRRAVRCAQNGQRSVGLGAALRDRRELNKLLHRTATIDDVEAYAWAREPRVRRRVEEEEVAERRGLLNRAAVGVRDAGLRRERARRAEKVRRAQQGRQDHARRNREGVAAARKEKQALEEQLKGEQERALEERMKQIKEERSKERDRRREFDQSNLKQQKEEMEKVREERATALNQARRMCEAAAPLSGAGVAAGLSLSRAQWHSRALNLQGVRSERERKAATMALREREREAEMERCAELHDMVVLADESRRQRGIAGGGAGFGEKTGGIVAITSPQRRRRQRQDDD